MLSRYKTLGIIGRGTAGAQAVLHFLRHSDCVVNWYYDPSVPTKAVGEGSNLSLPRQMARNIGFSHRDLRHVDGTFKVGIYKEGWGREGTSFFHDFPAPAVAWHFDAIKLQNYIFNLCKTNSRVNLIEGAFTPEDVDVDFVLDCSGRPKTLTQEFIPADNIPVNAVYVSHCDWSAPQFDYTLTIARPYGWVFGIPLGSRCAIGYLYNNNINTLAEVKEDVEKILEKYELTCTRTASFPFLSYYRRENFTERVGYNGDSSFFLEPLEATSTSTMETVSRYAFDILNGADVSLVNKSYIELLEEIYDMIMMHYYAGSKFKTDFWGRAQNLGEKHIQKAFNKERFFTVIKQGVLLSEICRADNNIPDYGTWGNHSFFQNIHGLGLYDDFKNRIQT